jgi:hypothetical protein
MFWNWGAFNKDADVPICLSYAKEAFQRRGLTVFPTPTEFATVGGSPDSSVIVHVTCAPHRGDTWIMVTAFSDNNNLAETTRNNVQSEIQARPAPPRPRPPLPGAPQVRID